jgi:hypothetical protein
MRHHYTLTKKFPVTVEAKNAIVEALIRENAESTVEDFCNAVDKIEAVETAFWETSSGRLHLLREKFANFKKKEVV